MGYKVTFADGSSETLDDATRMEQDGSGLRLFDEDGGMVASYRDGQYARCSKTSATQTPAPTVPE